MAAATKHIICKQTVDVAFYGREEDAFACQQKISRLWEDTLLSRLDTLLDALADKETLIRIPYLDVELENIRLEDLEAQFTEALLSAIKAKVSEAVDVTEVASAQQERTVLSLEEAALEVWLFFLQHGYLPVWSHAPDMAAIETQVARLLTGSASTLAAKLEATKKVLQQPAAAKRLALQGTPGFVWQVITALNPAEAPLLLLLHQDVRTLLTSWETKQPVALLEKQVTARWLSYAAGPVATRRLNSFVQEVCSVLLPPGRLSDITLLKAQLPPRESWRTALQQMEAPGQRRTRPDVQPVADNIQPPDVAFPAMEDDMAPVTTPREGTVIYIDNAGLVLLAPFLSTFLQACGCVKGQELLDPFRAVYLLQYLVNGAEAPAEFDLVLNKILCGIPIAVPLPPFGGILEAEKKEAAQLLQTVITHWQALKKTSVTGLQQSFLQRQGKLLLADGQWTLQVTQQPYDMLLEHLPWSVRYIKNSWMQQMIVVEWF